ncbi:MAG: glycosyltransferase [Candidatus Paceibacteria bacterium]
MNKILFSGGGTLGSTTPLLAIRDNLGSSDYEFIWVGTRFGPEDTLIEKKNIKFYPVFSGKIRRYLSVKNLIDPFKILLGLFQSIYILLKEKPDICISAGGFVSVPVHLSAWLLNIPTWVHQQDVKPGLSNKIMARFADKVTVALEESKNNFPNSPECIGNPLREEVYQGREEKAKKVFNIKSDRPVIFVLGGGTGAKEINELIVNSLDKLNDFEIIHVVGPKRNSKTARKKEHQYDNYHVFEFLDDEMKHAYALADVVICRAGFSTLTELAALEIPAILVPKEGHQKMNSRAFSGPKNYIDFKQTEAELSDLLEKLMDAEVENADILNITSEKKIDKIIRELLEN